MPGPLDAPLQRVSVRACAVRGVLALALALAAAGCSGVNFGAQEATGPAGESCATNGAEQVDRSASSLDLPAGVELEQHVTYTKLPCGWKRTEHGLAVRGATGGFSPNVNVLHRRLPAPQTVSEFARSNQSQFAMLGKQPGSQFKQLKFGPRSVFGGQPGYEFAFRRTAGGKDLVQVQDYMVRGNDAWSATLTATLAQYGKREAEMLGVLRGATINP